MSSPCDQWPWRTAALEGRVMGLGAGWNENTQTYLKPLTTSLLLQMWRTKRHVKSCNLSKEKKTKTQQQQKKKTSTELLLGIYLTKLNEKERRRKSWASSAPGLGRRKTPFTLCPFPFLLQGRSVNLGTSGFHLQYSDPSHLPRAPPFLSHGALISTDQAFNLVMMEDSMLSYAYRTDCKNIYMNQCIKNFLKVSLWCFSFVNLVMKYCMNLVIIYFLRATTLWESSEMLPLPVAGEVLPWKLNRFGPECFHLHLFTVLFHFKVRFGGREYLFF